MRLVASPSALALVAACLASVAAPLPAAEAQMPVVFQQSFEGQDPLAKWEPMDPKAWKIATDGDNKVLSMYRNSKYRPKVRSPHNYALIRDLVVGDFVLELKMQSKTRDYGHRDLCLFFGHQDPSHFYYVHMALRADPHAHSVFLVNGKPRVSIARKRTKGLVWGDGWHKVKLVRRAADGLIEVYFDDMTRPIMQAEDRQFTWGRIGVGSFDDLGNYDDIVIRGTRVEPKR